LENTARAWVPVLLALGVLTDPASADELPVFCRGMWEVQHTLGTERTESKRCTNPTEDMRHQNAMLEKAGCRFPLVTKSGSTYRFSAGRSVKDPSGMYMNSRTASVLTVESDSAYRVQVEATTHGQPTKELLVVRHLRDCKN
jgi:hypothetical protein